MSKVNVVLGSGERFPSTLMPGIVDGTSNTIQFGAALPPAESLKSGFSLLLPAVQKARFQPGNLVPTLQLLPYMEQSSVRQGSVGSARGLKIQGAKIVKAVQQGDGSVRVWMEPQGIIAILIGL